MTHTECEVKYLIERLEYERAVLGVLSVTQINHYFSCGDETAEYALRIRTKGGDKKLTLKIGKPQRADTFISNEYTMRIDDEKADAITAKGISAKRLNKLFGTHIPATLHFDYIGSLTTVRTLIRAEGLTFEFDKSEYLGVTDYEVECECATEEEIERAKMYLKKNFSVSSSSPKIRRFLDRLAILKEDTTKCG